MERRVTKAAPTHTHALRIAKHSECRAATCRHLDDSRRRRVRDDDEGVSGLHCSRAQLVRYIPRCDRPRTGLARRVARTDMEHIAHRCHIKIAGSQQDELSWASRHPTSLTKRRRAERNHRIHKVGGRGGELAPPAVDRLTHYRAEWP